MAYTIDPGEQILGEVRAIAHDQASAAVADLEDPGDDAVEAIHDCRKRCKKVRGLVRLVRPALGGGYEPANTSFRDAARELSALRDAHALLETFDALCAAQPEHLPDGGLAAVREELLLRSERARRTAGADSPQVGAALTQLHRGARLIDGWELDSSGFDAIEGGLGKTYRRGRIALHTAITSPTAGHFHELRKRVKYTWYHIRLLGETAPALLGPLAATLHDLSDTLGDDHDLAVLSEQLLADPGAHGGDDEVAAAMIVMDGQRADLQRRAISAGVRLYGERPTAFVDRIGAYWTAWRQHGPERATGEIDALDRQE